MFREQEEAIKDENNGIDENDNDKDDATPASSVTQIEQPPQEADNEEGKHAISDEEFEGSSMSLDTEGKRIMAEFDKKSSLLREQFAEENRAAVESIENVKKEIRASQEKEATITQEFDEMRMRYDNVEENLRRLEEVSKRREREEQKWRKKMDKRMKKNASRLEKVRAERLQHQKEKEEEIGKADELNNAVQELGSAAAETDNDAHQGTEDPSKEVLYDPADVTDYSSVEELEKGRKELRRLEKLKKKAIKREKLERKEKKKIKKEKRRVERKLAKMKDEKSAATENTEESKCDDAEHSGMCSIVVQNKLDEHKEENTNEQPDAQSTVTCEVEDFNSCASFTKEPEQYPTEELSSQLEVPKSNQNFQSCAAWEDEMVTENPFSQKDEIIIEKIPGSLDPQVKNSTVDQVTLKFKDYVAVSGDWLLVDVEEYEENSKESIVPNPSDEQQNEKDTKDDGEKEEPLKNTTEDLSSIEEEIDIRADSGSEEDDERSPVFNERSPLIRKQSGIFTFHGGLQPLFAFPEKQDGTDFSDEDLSEYHQPDEKSSEENSWNKDSKVHITDLPEGVEDALLQRCVDSKDGKDGHKAEKMDIKGIYQEVCNRSSHANFFNVEASAEHSNQVVEAIKHETEEPFSNDQHLLSFVQPDDENIQAKQQSLDENEAPSQEEKSVDTEVSVGCDDGLSHCEDEMSGGGRLPAENNEIVLTEDIEISSVHEVKENDTLQTDYVEGFPVCEDDLHYNKDVICEEHVGTVCEETNMQKEDVEVSVESDGDLDYSEDAICEDGEDDSEKTEDIEVASVCDEGCDYIENVIWDENVSSAGVENNMQTEDIEVSTVSDHTVDVIYKDGLTSAVDDLSVKTEDIEISSVCDKDLDYIEDVICKDGVALAVDDHSVKTEDVEVSRICKDDFDIIEDVICDKKKNSAREDESVQTEDIEVSSVNEYGLDYIEDVICDKKGNSAREDESVQTEDIEVSSVNEYSLDYIEDVIFQEERSLFGEDVSAQTENIEVSNVFIKNIDYIKNEICEEVVKYVKEEDLDRSDSREQSNLVTVCCKVVDSSTSDENQNVKEQAFIDDFDKLLDQCEEQMEREESPPCNCDGGKEKHSSENVICRSHNSNNNTNNTLEKLMPLDEMQQNVEIPLDDVPASDETPLEYLVEKDNTKISEDVDGGGSKGCDDNDKIPSKAISSHGQSQKMAPESIPKSSITEKEDKRRDDEPTACAEDDCIQWISDVDSMLSSSDEESYLSSKSVKRASTLAEEDSSEDSFTSVSELNEELSSCGQEGRDINGEIFEDEDDDPDLWNSLDDQTFPCCRHGKCSSCLRAIVGRNRGDDGQLGKVGWEHKGSVAAVANTAEHFLQKELSDALKTAVGFSSAEHKKKEIIFSKDESFKREVQFKKEPRQLKRGHSKVTKKLQESLEEIQEKNKALMEIVDFTNKENEKLLDQVIAMKEEAKTINMERESCQSELAKANHEVKRLKANEEYKERELTNLRDDIEKKEWQLKDMKDDLDYAQMDKKDLLYDIDLLKDKLKESEERNKDLQFQVDQLKQMAKEVKVTANWGHKEHDYSYLREEVELLKGSLDLSKHQEELSKGQLNDLKKSYTSLRNENEQIARINNELKDEHEKIMKQLKDQRASLEREISTTDREDKLTTLQKENSRITAQLADVSEKYKQLSELQDEKESITMRLQKQLAKLEKEKSTMVAELSKMSDKDKQLNGLLKQVEELKNQNKNLQHKALVAKEQVADKITSSTEESSEDGKLLKTKQSRYKFEIKKLKKRVRQNESEIEHLGRFARQTGPDARETTMWLNWLKDERIELYCVRNALKLQTERVQYLEDKERELENVKTCLHQKENELVQTQDGLKLMAETTEAFNRCVREMDNFLQYADSNTCNSDISSIIDDRDRDDLNDSANLDICPLNEDGKEELPVNSKEESVENEHSRRTVNSEKETGHKPLSTIPEHEEVAVSSGEKDERKMLTVHEEEEAGYEGVTIDSKEDNGHKGLIVKLEEDFKPIKAQVAHANEVLNDSLENIQYVKEALKQRQESWDQKSNKRDFEMAHLRHLLRIKDGEIESVKQYVSQVEDDSVEIIKELQGKLESLQNKLKEKEATLNEADDMLTSILACSGTRDHEFDDSMDFIEKLDATIEELKGIPESAQKLLQEKEASLKQAENMLTTLLATSETSDFTQLQEKLQSTPILLKEKTEALMKAEAEVQIKASLLITTEANHEDIVKKLKEELKSLEIALKEKTAEAKLSSRHASSEPKHDEFVKQLQEGLKMSQSSLQKKTKALEQTEEELEMKSSLLSAAETKHNELVEQFHTNIGGLQKDLEKVKSLLIKKTEELEQTKAELQIKSSNLFTAEEKHGQLMGKLDDTIKDLENMKNSLIEKTDALGKAEAQLELKASLLVTAETKHDKITKNLNATIKGLQSDLEITQSLLMEKTDALEEAEKQLRLKASLLATAETQHDKLRNLNATIKGLQSDLERTQSLLNEKTDALEKVEAQLELKATETQHDKLTKNLDATIKGLQSDLERTQSSLMEKTDALEEAEKQLRLKASLLATAETQHDKLTRNLNATIKGLQSDLKRTQSSLMDKADALDKVETKLHLEASIRATAETKNYELMRNFDTTIKGLQIDLQRAQISVTEKTGEVKQAEAQLKSKESLLATVEKNHNELVRQKDDELKNMEISLKETKAKMEQAKETLRLKASLLETAEAQLNLRDSEIEEMKNNDLKLETMVKRLEGEVKKKEMCLKEKTAALEKTQTDLHLKTLLLADADRKSKDIFKKLEGDLKTTQKSLKDTETALEKAQLDLQSKSSLVTSLEAKVCLRENELEELKLAHKGRDLELERVSASLEDLTKLREISDTLIAAKNKDIVSLKKSLTRNTEEVHKMKFYIAPTQDKLQLVSAELARAKNAKTKLLREVTAAVTRLENQKIAADRERSVLKKQIDNVLEDDEWKTKRIQDLKMNLKVSRIQVSKLESEKREMEECCRDYKERTEDEIKWLKQALKASNENNAMYESRIFSKKQENSEVRREIQRLKSELFQKDTNEMTQDGAVDVSCRPLMVRFWFIASSKIVPLTTIAVAYRGKTKY